MEPAVLLLLLARKTTVLLGTCCCMSEPFLMPFALRGPHLGKEASVVRMCACADADAPPGFEDVAPGTHDVCQHSGGPEHRPGACMADKQGLCLRYIGLPKVCCFRRWTLKQGPCQMRRTCHGSSQSSQGCRSRKTIRSGRYMPATRPTPRPQALRTCPSASRCCRWALSG